MKIKKRVAIPIVGLLVLVFIMFLSSNFSVRKMSMENSVSDMDIGFSTGTTITEEAQSKTAHDDSSVEPSKVITNVHISLETLKFNSTIDNLTALIAKHNGYVENSNISNNNHYSNKIFKNANYTLRIPKEKVDSFISEVGSIGNRKFNPKHIRYG